MNSNRNIFLRNSVTIIMLCNLMYFWFPFRSIVWKLMFVIIAVIGLNRYINERKKKKFDVIILLFFGIQLLYWIIGFFKYQSVMGNIAFCLLSFPLFSYLGKKGVLTDKYIRFVLIAFTGLSIICYYHYKTAFLVEYDYDVSGTRINFTLFLFLLPLLFAEKNIAVSVPLFIVCLVFNLLGAKRGNIIASIIPTVLFFVSIHKQSSLDGKLLFFGIIIGMVVLLEEIIMSNTMIVFGYNKILAGDSSGRDILYSYFWNKWRNSDNILTMLFGYGFGGTVKDKGTFAHNDWIELLVDNGLVGVVLYLFLLISFFMQIKKSSCLQIKYLLFSISIIWLLKSIYSMGFLEAEMSIMAIGYGYAVGYEHQFNSQRIKNISAT